MLTRDDGLTHREELKEEKERPSSGEEGISVSMRYASGDGWSVLENEETRVMSIGTLEYEACDRR